MLQTFETDRLLLRERTLEDLQNCIDLDRDLEVVKYIPGIVKLLHGPESSAEKHRGFVKERIETDYPEGLGYWAIESKDSREFIGWILLIPIDNLGPEVEIGWRLKRSHWGKGYATEAARVILQHAFRNVDLNKVVADIVPLNHGSIRVAEKIGLKFECENKHDVRYSISNSEIE